MARYLLACLIAGVIPLVVLVNGCDSGRAPLVEPDGGAGQAGATAGATGRAGAGGVVAGAGGFAAGGAAGGGGIGGTRGQPVCGQDGVGGSSDTPVAGTCCHIDAQICTSDHRAVATCPLFPGSSTDTAAWSLQPCANGCVDSTSGAGGAGGRNGAKCVEGTGGGKGGAGGCAGAAGAPTVCQAGNGGAAGGSASGGTGGSLNCGLGLPSDFSATPVEGKCCLRSNFGGTPFICSSDHRVGGSCPGSIGTYMALWSIQSCPNGCVDGGGGAGGASSYCQ